MAENGNGNAEFRRWVVGVAGTVLAGLVIASIVGNIAMYRQVGVLQESVARLAESVKVLTDVTTAEISRSRIEDEVLKISHRSIQARLSAIDKQVGAEH